MSREAQISSFVRATYRRKRADCGAFYSRCSAGRSRLAMARAGCRSETPMAASFNIHAEGAYEPPVWPEHPRRQANTMHFEVPVETSIPASSSDRVNEVS